MSLNVLKNVVKLTEEVNLLLKVCNRLVFNSSELSLELFLTIPHKRYIVLFLDH